MVTSSINPTNDELILTINDGDKEIIDNVMTKWGFKDHQSFLRFASSILVDTNGNFLYIQGENSPVRVSPAAHLLKDGE